MQQLSVSLQKAEFEARIFVSFSIVAAVCALSYTLGGQIPSAIVLLGAAISLDRSAAFMNGYVAMALIMAAVSLLRMWAGSELTPRRVMAFRVQVDALKTTGPYLLVRNPIYLADFIAMCAFAACLPLTGALMPLLFYVHYVRLIVYEEGSLHRQFGEQYAAYAGSVPRLIPSLQSLLRFLRAGKDFRITPEGVRHNALYVLFVPGFALAAVTGEFLYAAVIGLPGVIDWGIIHTRIGIERKP